MEEITVTFIISLSIIMMVAAFITSLLFIHLSDYILYVKDIFIKHLLKNI
jgi:hypothetical protein